MNEKIIQIVPASRTLLMSLIIVAFSDQTNVSCNIYGLLLSMHLCNCENIEVGITLKHKNILYVHETCISLPFKLTVD